MLIEHKCYIWMFSVLSEKIRRDFEKYERYELYLDSLCIDNDNIVQKPEIGAICTIDFQVNPRGKETYSVNYKCKSKSKSIYIWKVDKHLKQMLEFFIKELEKRKQNG